MFVRQVRFILSEQGRSKAQAIADDVIPQIRQQPGCQSALFYSDADGVSGMTVVWDTRENADAAAAVIGPRLAGHLAGNLTGLMEQHVFPVLAH